MIPSAVRAGADPATSAADRPRHDAARTVADVVEAWSLVYEIYRRADLIEANPARLHFVGAAIAHESVVAVSRVDRRVETTLSAYHDGPEGLPLDRVHGASLDRLRREGRSLIEVGLFAHRGGSPGRAMAAVCHLMRMACGFGVHTGATDALVGVHPRHAGSTSGCSGSVGSAACGRTPW